MSDPTEVTDHACAQERFAAYLAGGLSVDESLRLETHIRDCAVCATALESARQLDSGLNALFAPIRPGPELEDFTILKLREGRGASWKMAVPQRVRRPLGAIAALLLLGTFGALAASLLNNGQLPMPGDPGPLFARAARGQLMLELADNTDSMAALSGVKADDLKSTHFMNDDLPGLSRFDGKTHDFSPPQFSQQGQPKTPPANWSAYMDGSVSEITNGRVGAGIGGGIGGFNGGFGGLGTPQFDPTAKPFGTTYGNPFYNGAYFKPSEHWFGLAPVFPAITPAPQPEPKKNPPGNTKTTEPVKPADPEPAMRRVVIRSGDIEFEVESFDSALATVTKLVAGLKGAFVATVNSEKLPNGKVKGSITVRTPPEHLDGLVLDLRRELGKGGELKGVKISSQDITKQYTDLESRLKAARTMETRLLQIIKEGKGEIKQLLEAEKELGVWRTKIEEFEGEIRYFANLAALSTLTITLAEKEIRTAAGLTESERVQAGVEVEDVDKAYQQLLAAVVEAKGRVSKSELKQLAQGQFNASLQFEVAPESSGPLRDRLHQLGRVARLEIDRVQSAQGEVTKETKAKRGDTVFLVQLYNLANVAPRETTTLSVAVTDVAAAYHALRDAVAKTTGRVHVAQLNEQDRQNLSAQLNFEVRRSEEAAIRAELDKVGEVIARQSTRAPESDQVTDSKVLYQTSFVAANRLKPREVMTLSVEVANVEQSVTLLSAQAADVKARQVDSRINREPNGKETAHLVYDVPLAAASGLAEQFKRAGTVRMQQSVRDPHAPEGKYATARIDVTLTSADKIVADNAGVWPPVKRGLAYSASALLTSLTWVVFGLCVVLPWAVIGYGGYRVVRWMGRPANPGAATPAA